MREEDRDRLLREMPGSRKVSLAIVMSEFARAMEVALIRRRHPSYSLQEARFAFWRQLHGDELFRKVWPDAPFLDP